MQKDISSILVVNSFNPKYDSEDKVIIHYTSEKEFIEKWVSILIDFFKLNEKNNYIL